MFEHFSGVSGRAAMFRRALPFAAAAAVLAAALFALAAPANAQTAAPNPDAKFWLQRLDDDGNPVDLTRDHWRQPYFNRFERGATSVKIRVYLLKDARTQPTAPSPSDYASWSDFSDIWLTVKSVATGNLQQNPLSGATLQNKDGSAQLVAGTPQWANMSPAVWHQNTAGYVNGAPTPTGSTAVPPIDITIDFGSGGLNARNFFIYTRKNCNNPCTGATPGAGDEQYEWKLPTRSADLGWGLFARLNGKGDPVVRDDGAAAWDDMHYLNQNSDTTLTVRFYYKATDADNPTSRPNSPSAPNATYADVGYVASVRIYQRDGSLRGNMHNVRYYTVGSTTERWAGCYNNTGIHQCYISKASLKAAATAADATASVDETDEVIPVDFDIVIPNSEVAGYPSVHFFARGGTDADLESGGARWPHGLGLIKRPTLSLHHRRNTWDRAESTCTHDYVAADTAATETAEQLAVIASDTAGGSLAHNCGNLSIAPGQSAFLGFWAGFAGPAAHPQEYFWNRNDNDRLYGWRSSQAMRIRELDRVNVTTRSGTFGISSRCPAHRYLDAPEGRFHDAEWPKPRTRDGMGSCTSTSVAWFAGSAERAAGTEYVAPAGLGIFTLYPTSYNSGTATLTATAYGTDRDGDGEPDWTATDELGVAFDSTKRTVSASDTFEAGETDNSPLAAYVSRSSYNGLISLKVGRLERHAFPIFPQRPSDRTGGAPYATVAELAADSNGDLTWQEGRSKFSDSRGAVLAGNYISPVIFENLAEDEAVRITVDRGVISHEGEACTTSAGGCTLSLSRAELMTSRGRGASGAVGTDARDPFVLSYLDYAPAGPGEATFTVQAFPADAAWPVADPTTYTETVPVIGALRVRTALQDADGVLDPGDRTGVTVGVEGPTILTPAGADILFTLGDGTYEAAVIDGSGRLIGYAEPSAPSAGQEFARGSYLVITGPATWSANGGKRLSVGSGSTFSALACIDANTIDATVEAGDSRVCHVVDGDGARPELLVDSNAADGSEIRITSSLAASVAPFTMAAWPADLSGPPRPYGLGGVFGAATFSVKSIRQLSGISVGRAPGADGSVPTGPIRINGKADIRLALANEDGGASQISAVSAITITVIGGGTLTGQGCASLASCTIEGDTGALFDAASANPSATSRIDLTFNAPKDPGTASIEVTVVGTDGSTFSDRLALTVSGSAAEIASSGEMPRVHSSATEDDDRDEVKIPITARDSDGNAARMPANAAAVVRGIDGAIVPSGRLTAQVRCTDEGRLQCNIEIAVTAAAGSPLSSGAYTATVTGSGVGSTEVGFAVGGPAETITLAVPATADLPGLASSFSATARVLDKAGIPVADGTWVTFDTTAASSATQSAIVTRPALSDHDNNATTDEVRRARTKNGEAGATVTVVGNGIAILTATVGSKTANQPIDTRVEESGAAAAGDDGPLVRFGTDDSAVATGLLAVWASSRQGDARQAIEQVPGASIVWLWNGVEWIRWGVTEAGTPVPGSSSSPFIILQGDRIWFAN